VKGDGGKVMVADPDPKPLHAAAGATRASALVWDRRYREGRDGWELGQPAPPLQDFFSHHPLAPHPPGRVLVPGCGRGHEARLLAELGFAVVGLDFSAEAIAACTSCSPVARVGVAVIVSTLPKGMLQTCLVSAACLLVSSPDGVSAAPPMGDRSWPGPQSAKSTRPWARLLSHLQQMPTLRTGSWS
jgi:SAM-dependent methyltransferase